MKVEENCDVTESAAGGIDIEHCSEVMTTKGNSSKDIEVNGVGSWKIKEESFGKR